MSNLSELLPAGAGAKSAEFVASGTLGSGVTVALNSDGTVEAVSGAEEGVGSPSVFEAATIIYNSATFDSNSNKVVIAYRDSTNANYGTAIVGTVSGTSISFGTAVVFATTNSQDMSATFDSNSNKVVIFYRDNGNSNYGTAIVGTVSGTSISFGTAVVFENAATYSGAVTYDSTNNKIVIAYRDGGNSFYGTAIVGTVSGTSISFGSAVVFESASAPAISTTYDSTNGKVVIAYSDGGNANYGTAIVGTVSGTSISFGSAALFNSGNSDTISSAYDSNAQKIVVVFRERAVGNYGVAVVGTVSGTSISFGTPVFFTSSNTSPSISPTTYDTNANKIVIFYKNVTAVNGSVIVGTVSGTSISFGAITVFTASSVDNFASTYDSNSNKVVTAYRDVSNSQYGTSIVFQNASSNNTDFIGITDQAIADTATGAVIVQGGVSDKVTSLTTGSDYYIQADGSISTTVSSVPAGRALSSTSILLEG